MRFYKGCSDDTFKMMDDWFVKCSICGERHVVDRNSLQSSVMEQGATIEHYFWGKCTCNGCGEQLFYRVKVYENPIGQLDYTDSECDSVTFLKEPLIETISRLHPKKTQIRSQSGKNHLNDNIKYYGGKRMDNLWLLTEERPKPSVVLQIIEMYCTDFRDLITKKDDIRIRPQIENGVFKFVYEVEGLAVKNAGKIYIKTVSGSSSFLDFLMFKQKNAPEEGCATDHLIMAIEETKTSDDESRNRITPFFAFP